MSTIRIYRLEDPQQVGPYHSCLEEWVPEDHIEVVKRIHSTMDKRHMRTDYHVNRLCSGTGGLRQWMERHAAVSSDVLHGCDSEQSLRKWFGPFYQLLRDSGFQLVAYEVKAEHCISFPEQVIFLHRNAIRIQ